MIINYQNIQHFNSKDISANNEATRIRTCELWASANRKSKNNVIRIGGYVNARAVYKTKSTGLISVRMAIAMALALNVDPYYIIATTNERTECTEERVINFARSWGFNLYAQSNEGNPSRDEILKYVEKIINYITPEKRQILEELSIADIKIMLDSPMIRMDIDKNSKIKLFIIKALLTS